MRVHRRGFVMALVVAAVWAVSCGPTVKPTATPTQTEGILRGLAPVDAIDVLILESFPVQVHVRVTGNLPDGCTTLGEITQERKGTAFSVIVGTMRPAGAQCTEALVPFQTTVALDVLGLRAGTYTVTVNGVSGSFKLSIDNQKPTTLLALDTIQQDLRGALDEGRAGARALGAVPTGLEVTAASIAKLGQELVAEGGDSSV